MSKDFASMEDSNRSANPSIHEVSDPARRVVVRGGLGAALLGPLAGLGLASCRTATEVTAPAGPRLGFASVPASPDDRVSVPAGYVATPFLPRGEPVGIAGAMPAFREDASNSAAEQALQMGMHHDGMHYYPLDGSRRGLLVMNHEYADDGLLHPGGLSGWSAEKVAKSQAAHGVSVSEIAWQGERWQAVRPSKYARRITATTPFAVAGPAAGHPLMRTAADPSGRLVLGTFNNCASGLTPWGRLARPPIRDDSGAGWHVALADSGVKFPQRYAVSP